MNFPQSQISHLTFLVRVVPEFDHRAHYHLSIMEVQLPCRLLPCSAASLTSLVVLLKKLAKVLDIKCVQLEAILLGLF